MATPTGTDPHSPRVPPGWPGDDPTVPDEVGALGHAPRPERTRARRERATAVAPVPAADDGAAELDDANDVATGDTTGPDVVPTGRRGRRRSSAPPDDADDLVAGVQPAGRVLVVMVAALVLAMLVNADTLVERAERQPAGRERERSLAVWHPVQDISHALLIHRIRQLADWVVGDDEPAGVASDAVDGGGASGDDRGDGEPRPGAPADGDGDGEATSGGPAAAEVDLRTPTREDPLRLWVGGDSMAQVFGQSLVSASEATGLVEPTLHYEMASGLTRRDYYDWPRALNAAMADRDPDVVVVVFGVNDAQGIVLADGTPIQEVADPRWVVEYRRRVGALMDQLRADDRMVIWVRQPPMREPGYGARMALVNQAYADEAASRPWVTLVDPASVLGDPTGAYADVVTDAAGTPADVRQSDGIHLTAAGGELLAAQVLALVEAQGGPW
jgi:uncharacterized protein